jgi:hypothetical protein
MSIFVLFLFIQDFVCGGSYSYSYYLNIFFVICVSLLWRE